MPGPESVQLRKAEYRNPGPDSGLPCSIPSRRGVLGECACSKNDPPGAAARRMAHDGARCILGMQSASNRAAARNAHLRRQSNRHQGVERCRHVSEPGRGIQQCDTFRSYEEQLSWRCWLLRRRAPAITGRPYLQPAASERRRSSWPDRLCQFVDPARTVKCASCGAIPSSTSVAVTAAPGSRLA
jgi:hypothetical protein